jgi:hypothetical protein
MGIFLKIGSINKNGYRKEMGTYVWSLCQIEKKKDENNRLRN